jgi:ABC-type transporter Mla maintaining outer membrane lipid asymmetry ATPase subunit MlaF
MLEVIELEAAKEMPVNLSGGMKKRVGLARAIINRPRASSMTNQPPGSILSFRTV